MDTAEFDRNEIAAANAFSEIPEIYKNELSNRLFTVYVDPHASSVIRSNIEFVAPILWKVLPKENKQQIVRRVDQEFPKGNSVRTKYAFEFVTLAACRREKSYRISFGFAAFSMLKPIFSLPKWRLSAF